MIRKGLFVGLALLLVAIAAAVVAITPDQAGLPAGCQQALDDYIFYRNDMGPGRVSARAVVRAARPAQLTAELSAGVWGDSAHYETDFHYRAEPAATLEWAGSAQRPVPFPPREVWCVLLQESNGGAAAGVRARQGFAFIARHQDLYNADWLVHQAAEDPFSPESQQAAAALGCSIAPDAVKASSSRP